MRIFLFNWSNKPKIKLFRVVFFLHLKGRKVSWGSWDFLKQCLGSSVQKVCEPLLICIDINTHRRLNKLTQYFIWRIVSVVILQKRGQFQFSALAYLSDLCCKKGIKKVTKNHWNRLYSLWSVESEKLQVFS